MKDIRIVNYLKDKYVNNFDLLMVIILTTLSVIFILLPPFNQTFLRIIFALPLLLFLPGYMLIAAMFPRNGELSGLERFTMSIGFSIAITVFDGFGLNYTHWGFRPYSITLSLSIIICIFLIITFIQRWRYKSQSYGFSIKDLRAFYKILLKKENEIVPEHDPAIEKMLIKTMIIAIIVVTAMLIYAKMTYEPEKFTTLYILGADGKAENYPNELSVGVPSKILVGIENHEYTPINYTLRVMLGGKNLKDYPIFLENGYKWVDNITFIPELTSSIAFAGENKSKLEIQLLRDNMTYRSVHLLVNASIDSARFSELPDLINGEMELNKGWLFIGSSPDVTGGYVNETLFSRVYEMNNYEETTNSSGKIFQDLISNGHSLATISFNVKDSENLNTTSFAYKQALLDGEVIWESRFGAANKSWEHIDVPVLLSGNSTVTFRVLSTNKTNIKRTVWWDDIKINPFKLSIPQLGEVNVRNGFAVKVSNFSNTTSVSSMKFSIENLEKIEKNLDFRPSPVLLDDLGNKYEIVKIEVIDKSKKTTINPGELKKGTISFKPINSDAKHLMLTLYINDEKYEFNFDFESQELEKVDELLHLTNATLGDIITKDGFAVMLKGYQNFQDWTSQLIISVKNIEDEEKTFKLDPAPVIIDNHGNQYGSVKIDRSSQIKQTVIYPGVIRRGTLFFEPIKSDIENIRTIIYLNGEKYIFSLKAEPKIIEEIGLISNKSMVTNATLGESINRDGFTVLLTGFQNFQGWTSQAIISVKNMENVDQPFKLDPSPVLIDDLGNQYEMVWIDRSSQIKQTNIYPGVIRRGTIFFENINPNAKNLRLILFLNKKKYEFGFNADSAVIEEKGLINNISNNIKINATLGETITKGGFEINLKSYENTPIWGSKIVISVKNIANEEKIFRFSLNPVLVDDLNNQYEMINIDRSTQIEQTSIAPYSKIEGTIFFEPIRTEAKYITFILNIGSENYIFGFNTKYNN